MPRKTSPAGTTSIGAPAASMRPRPDAAENAAEPRRARRAGVVASMRPRPDAAENRRRRRHELDRADASMRPRPDAAENDEPAQVAVDPAEQASMRPRPDAAENQGVLRLDLEGGLLASMRPRPDAAENEDEPGRRRAGLQASMRPRPDAAENAPPRVVADAQGGPRFNEAAARCRGKRPGPERLDADARMASMRPRPDAAENRSAGRRRRGRRRRFNEAAARCRGKLRVGNAGCPRLR